MGTGAGLLPIVLNRRKDLADLLQRRVSHDGIAEIVFVLVIVRMAAVDDDAAGIVIGGDAMSRVAVDIVMSIGAEQRMRDVVAGDAELEPIAIPAKSVPQTVVVR